MSNNNTTTTTTTNQKQQHVATTTTNTNTIILSNLQNDISSLHRVRNRLASSPPPSLPHILTNLLPRLIKRLDDNATHLHTSSHLSPKERELRNDYQTNLMGLLTAALERTQSLRRCVGYIVPLVPFLESEWRIVRMMVLSFLTVVMPRYHYSTTDGDDNVVTTSTTKESSSSSPPVTELLALINRLHSQRRTKDSSSGAAAFEERSIVSWCLMESLALLSSRGQFMPLIDWESREYISPFKGDGGRTLMMRGMDGEKREGIVKLFGDNDDDDGGGVFELYLHILTYRWNNKPTTNNNNGGNNDASSMEGRDILERRNKNNKNDNNRPYIWNDVGISYMKDMSTLMMRHLQRELRQQQQQQQCQQRNNDNGSSSSGKLSQSRRMILGILSRSTPGSLTRPLVQRETTNNDGWCFDVVLALLIFILGHDIAMPILHRYPTSQKRWDRLMGDSPSYAAKQQQQRFARGALPSFCRRFIVDEIVSRRSTMEKKINLTDEGWQLMMELSLACHDQLRDPYCAIRLVDVWYHHRRRHPQRMKEGMMMRLHEKCVDCVGDVLSMLALAEEEMNTIISVDDDDNNNNNNNNEAENNNNRQTTTTGLLAPELLLGGNTRGGGGDGGGIPPLALPPHEINTGRRLYRRNDFNVLMMRHRREKRWERLFDDEALKARHAAYEILNDLTPSITITTPSSSSSSSPHNNQRISFALPILLLKCLTFDHHTLQPLITNALHHLLTLYQSQLVHNTNGTSLHHRQSTMARFLPSLLTAIICDVSAARRAAGEWISELLCMVDGPAAVYLARYLMDDEDETVVKWGRKVVMKREQRDEEEEGVERRTERGRFEFVTGEDSSGVLKRELWERVGVVAGYSGVEMGKSAMLLHDCDYSVVDAVAAASSPPTPSHDDDNAIIAVSNGTTSHNDDDSTTLSYCPICYDDDITSSYALSSCRHRFCRSCYISHVNVQLSSSSSSLTVDPLQMTCPDSDCSQRVTLWDVQSLTSKDNDDGLVKRYEKAWMEQFVLKNHDCRYCPGIDCQTVIIRRCSSSSKGGKGRDRTVTCRDCHSAFCFDCGGVSSGGGGSSGGRPILESHGPANCDDLYRWNDIFQSCSFWIKKNAKPCPGCQIPIEKNQGCNHMKCSKCKIDFCWLCLTRLERHLESHDCRRYDPSSAVAVNDEEEEERRSLYYTDRYRAHHEAMMFALELQKRQEQLLQQQDRRGSSATDDGEWYDHRWGLLSFYDDDYDVLISAGETIVMCRRFLKYSYVAAWGARRRRREEEGQTTIMGGQRQDNKEMENDDDDDDDGNLTKTTTTSTAMTTANTTTNDNVKPSNDDVIEIFENHVAILELFAEKLSQLTERNLEQIYRNEGGQRGLKNYFKAVMFYEMSVKEYIKRIWDFVPHLDR